MQNLESCINKNIEVLSLQKTSDDPFLSIIRFHLLERIIFTQRLSYGGFDHQSAFSGVNIIFMHGIPFMYMSD